MCNTQSITNCPVITGELMLETKSFLEELISCNLAVLRSISKCAYDQYVSPCNAFRGSIHINASFDKISSTKFGKEICHITQVTKRNNFKIACQKWYQISM